MALTPCMSCLKTCGYLCGILSALNIWFWLGLTIFNAMGNPWIAKNMLLYPKLTEDTSRFTTVFAICLVVSSIFLLKLTFCFFLRQTSSAWLDAAGALRPAAIKTKTRSFTTLVAVVPASAKNSTAAQSVLSTEAIVEIHVALHRKRLMKPQFLLAPRD